MKRKNKVILDPPFYDDEEKEIIEAFNRGEFKPAENQEQLKKDLQEAARNSIELRKKSKNVSLRLPGMVVYKLKEKAAQNGLPYQTLIGTILHKYAEGQIEIKL